MRMDSAYFVYTFHFVSYFQISVQNLTRSDIHQIVILPRKEHWKEFTTIIMKVTIGVFILIPEAEKNICDMVIRYFCHASFQREYFISTISLVCIL